MLLLGVLQAQAAGAPVGAGSFDLLETQVLASSAASVTFSSLSTYAADYQHLQIRMVTRGDNAGAGLDGLWMYFNADTASNYAWHRLYGEGTTVLSDNQSSINRMLAGIAPRSTSPANGFGAVVTDILDPFETTKKTTIRSLVGFGASNIALHSGFWNNTNALSSITIYQDSNMITGSRFSIYGLKVGA